jgi:hypothetical protein
MKFLVGMTSGVALAILAFALFRPAPRPEHVCAGPEPHSAGARPAPVVLAQGVPESAPDAPVRESAAAPAGPAADATKDAKRREARTAFFRQALLGEEGVRLPSARRCLADPELNPDGTKIEDEQLLGELERLIAQQNANLNRIGDDYAETTAAVIRGKLDAGIDPPSTWSRVPADQIVHKATQFSVASPGSPAVSSGTLVRRGEIPELDVLQAELARARIEAREVVAAWIAGAQR